MAEHRGRVRADVREVAEQEALGAAEEDHTMATGAEWPDERTRIVYEVFAEQVRIGNRSNTHLNKVGYNNVIANFKEKTGLSYTKLQFKNRWDKLKREYNAWKLLLKQTGLGWDETMGTATCDAERWKKLKKDIPGSFRFEHRGLQNEDNLKVMFEDLRNTGADHWDASSGALAGSPHGTEDEGEGEGDDDEDSGCEEVTPPSAKGKRARGGEKGKGKKAKTSGKEWLQDRMDKIVALNEKTSQSCESMARREDHSECSIKAVMALVKECGAKPSTKEFFVASEIFTKRPDREMFMTLDTPEE